MPPAAGGGLVDHPFGDAALPQIADEVRRPRRMRLALAHQLLQALFAPRHADDDAAALREGAGGYNTVAAADGDEALRKLREGLEPCLILLDLMMPWKDGFQFRREQLRDPKLSEIPVIVLSGRHQPDVDGPLLKAAAYVQKP